MQGGPTSLRSDPFYSVSAGWARWSDGENRLGSELLPARDHPDDPRHVTRSVEGRGVAGIDEFDPFDL